MLFMGKRENEHNRALHLSRADSVSAYTHAKQTDAHTRVHAAIAVV